MFVNLEQDTYICLSVGFHYVWRVMLFIHQLGVGSVHFDSMRPSYIKTIQLPYNCDDVQ
jgi:hypothetical protein